MSEPTPDPFLAYLREAASKLDAHLPTGSAATSDDAAIEVVKLGHNVLMSDELLMDAGVIPDTRPRVRVPWHRRLRWRWAEWRERTGRKVGSWVAGVDLSERDDDW